MDGVSLQPKQFRQQTLWSTAAETTHVEGSGRPIEMGIRSSDRRDYGGQVEFQTHRALDRGGSSSMWQSQAQLERFGDRNNRRPAEGPTAREAELGSGQLPMFMSPREIHARYSPLDGDRYSGYDSTFDGTETRSMRVRDEYGDPLETDDELWDRKLHESQEAPSEYERGLRAQGLVGMKTHTGTETFMERVRDQHSSYPVQGSKESSDSFYEREASYLAPHIDEWREANDVSLYDSIAEKGVKAPIRLGQDEGRMGKPMIVGGHHRLAAQTDLNYDRLMPVLHHKNIYEAQYDPDVNRAWPYT